MKVALISDIHSNLYAFDAVLHELEKETVDLTVFLGDIAHAGIYPRECIARLLDIKPLIAIKGNADGLFDEIDEGWKPETEMEKRIYVMHQFVRSLMTAEDIRTLKELPLQATVDADGTPIGFHHGSPRSYGDRVYADFTDQEIEERYRGCVYSVAAFGHTHQRMHRTVGRLELINPGAVGFSFDGDNRAGFGILHAAAGETRYEQRNVVYSISRYAADLRRSAMPFCEEYVQQLQTAESNRAYVDSQKRKA